MERMRIMKFINGKKVFYTKDNFIRYYDSLKLNETGEQIWNKIKDELQKKKPEERYKIVEKNNEKYIFYNGIDDIILESKINKNNNVSFPVITLDPGSLGEGGFGGSSENKLYIHNGERYMVKYSKTKKNKMSNKDLTIHRQTALTEFLASSILKLYGMNVQEVLFGYDSIRKEYCVLCKLFCRPSQIVPFDRRSSQDTRKKRFVINDFEYISSKIINRYDNLNKKEALDNWITISVTDSLIGNRDRNMSNLGYIDETDGLGKNWSIPPIFDNGASLGCYLHIEDNYEWNENEKQKVIKEQRLYQLYNNNQINYNNIVNHKLAPIFYEKAKIIFKDKEIKGLDLFDNMKKLPYLDTQQRYHIQLAKDIYKFNFETLQSVM